MSDYEDLIKLASTGALGGVSFCLCAVSVYWLLRMKRVFRNDLQLLMLCTDLVKSFAYLALPLAAWSGLQVDSKSNYCQFSGFIMAFTVEATDYLMLVLAIHTVLYIFREYHNPGFGGLYHYRYAIYSLWVVVPGLIASLAFINPEGGYASVGALCYLPKDPMWYRMGLAWIPRGFVFLSILVVQSAIYFYIVRNIKSFQKAEESSNTTFVTANEDQNGNCCDNLEFITTGPNGLFEPSVKESCTDSVTRCLEQNDASLPCNSDGQTSLDLESKHHNLESQQGFNNGYSSSTTVSKTTDESDRPYMSGNSPSMTDKRQELLRQARLLFIYPAIYVMMWMFPMISQILQYTQHYATGNPPFWISLLWGLFLAAQAGVDALVFILRERPWRKKTVPLPPWVMRVLIALRIRRE